MPRKTTNNLNSNFSLSDLSILAESMKDKKLANPYLLVLQFDKRTMTKEEKESCSVHYIKSYYTNDINNIFLKPNVSKFTIHCSNDGTYCVGVEGKRSNLSVSFTVDTTDKDSKYLRSTYRVEFKDTESLLRGLRVYATLATQSKDKVLRRKLRTYFTALELL